MINHIVVGATSLCLKIKTFVLSQFAVFCAKLECVKSHIIANNTLVKSDGKSTGPYLFSLKQFYIQVIKVLIQGPVRLLIFLHNLLEADDDGHTGVEALVNVERGFLREAFVTDVALEGALAGVRARVYLQVGLAREGGGALRALIRPPLHWHTHPPLHTNLVHIYLDPNMWHRQLSY